MRLFVSIVSHRHHSILINLGTMKRLVQHPDIVVVCRDNIPAPPLAIACKKYGVHYQRNTKPEGFAANNNANFEYCKTVLGMRKGDYFVVFNPDLLMDDKAIDELVISVRQSQHPFLVPNLFLDREELVQDDNIRTYPSLLNFLQTYFLNKRVTMIDRRDGLIKNSCYWASGAFLVVKAYLYQSVKGLDERYYMYCEDIDFCARLRKQNVYFHYLAHVKATHLRRRDSKRFLSQYFWWHVASVLKYSLWPKDIKSKKSSITNGFE